MIAFALALSLFEGGARAITGATPPAGLTLSAESCGDCHVKERAAWSASRHAGAYTNEVFVASYAREPSRWCLYCHAPLPEQVAVAGQWRTIEPGRAPLADEGVGCAACHVRDGAVLGVRAPSPAALAAHPVRVEPRLATEEACAGCHQFAFPREDRRTIAYTDEAMQDTVAEWRRAGAQPSCQRCHMPAGAHTFQGGHDADYLRRSIEIDVRRRDASHVVVTLRARETPHRTPTGDPFRRLWVELCDDETCEVPIARPAFARSFARVGGRWRLHRDATIPARGEAVRIVATGERIARRWRLVYAYAAGSSESDLDDRDAQIELARGELAAP